MTVKQFSTAKQNTVFAFLLLFFFVLFFTIAWSVTHVLNVHPGGVWYCTITGLITAIVPLAFMSCIELILCRDLDEFASPPQAIYATAFSFSVAGFMTDSVLYWYLGW